MSFTREDKAACDWHSFGEEFFETLRRVRVRRKNNAPILYDELARALHNARVSLPDNLLARVLHTKYSEQGVYCCELDLLIEGARQRGILSRNSDKTTLTFCLFSPDVESFLENNLKKQRLYRQRPMNELVKRTLSYLPPPR